ncbi:SGNH/GDSL hydrolase family protein [Psychrobacter sp. FDAARGOS_221]|uniref:SGNH/GDSL hydrolase family protein n=1 Tax=Psychrobacter sp. FDAARGOS_221 TaxID=1975705 RepID=UPI001D0D22B0|nr:SGNH/GDSL hydrolase family protein [Psychrobacter sp. FDAARGOS_221]
MQKKDIVLAPIYLYQGLKLKRTAVRLPEAEGERYGSLELASSKPNTETDNTSTLTFMMAGDSSAAGVGVDSQHNALVGHLLNHLQTLPQITDNYTHINWSLHATSGHTSYDVLRRLYVLPIPKTPMDVVIVLVGVNDTTANVSPTQWQAQLREIIELSKRKFGARYVLFPGLPPMQHMPAIPRPLNQFLGAKTALMNQKLNEVCQEYDKVLALPMQFENTGLTADELFSIDGFHPNSTAYSFLALKLAKTLAQLVEDGELA